MQHLLLRFMKSCKANEHIGTEMLYDRYVIAFFAGMDHFICKNNMKLFQKMNFQVDNSLVNALVCFSFLSFDTD